MSRLVKRFGKFVYTGRVIHGTVAPGWAGVRDAFAANLDEGLDAGAALTVLRHGRPVVELHGGIDPLSGRDFRAESVTLGFSVAKGITSVCALQLVERGLLDLDTPVARYWPEFAAEGKGAITVRDVLTHRAALPVIDLDPITEVVDWDRATSTLAAQPPRYDGRRYFVYHALTFGFLVGELVRRLSGMPFDAYVREHLARPLGLQLWIGAPPEADAHFLPGLTDDVDATPLPVVPAWEPCRSATESGNQLMPLFRRVDGRQGSEPFNQPEFRRAAVPAGNAVVDARSLARMYAACLGEVDGVRLLGPEIVGEASRDQAGGILKLACDVPDPEAQGTPQPWGLGFEVSNPENPMLGPGSFGHSGMGGRLGFAHPPSGVAFGFIAQRMLYPAPGTLDPRWTRLLDAVSAAIAQDDAGTSSST